MNKRKEFDIEIKLSGKGLMSGGLGPDEMRSLADLLDGLRRHDPKSLGKIHVFGNIKKGSAIVRAASPSELGLMEVNQARVSLQNFFLDVYDVAVGWLWNNPARAALKSIVERGQTITVKVMPAHQDDQPVSQKFTKSEYELYSQNIAPDPTWRTLNGTVVEIDLKDRKFEVLTPAGVIVCGFPDGAMDEKLLSMANQTVAAAVLCRDKPGSGSWKAVECKNVSLAPSQSEMFNSAIYPPGIKPPKKPMPNGFSVHEFAPSLDAQAGEDLAAFLQQFEG